MCTAILMQLQDSFFGRNLDLDCGFGERAVITPRRFLFSFRAGKVLHEHYAMVGMARVEAGYPLYAEAINEKGVGMAGLHFPSNAFYETPIGAEGELASFELIPWILGQARDADEAAALLRRARITDAPFHQSLPPTPLHWMLADATRAYTVEATADGLQLYENPVRVLTNNPPFPLQLSELPRYDGLTNTEQQGFFSEIAGKGALGLGSGAWGLPGDYSSSSRFAKAAWLLRHCEHTVEATEEARAAQVLRVLGAVSPVYGSVLTKEGKPHYTVYSCCGNLMTGRFYYQTAQALQVQTLSLQEADLKGTALHIRA